jgi:hypothetical protein
MKRKHLLPEIPTEALRDYGTPARVERIWRRLESDLATAPARPRAALWWAPAAVVIVFGSGVVVGAAWRPNEPSIPAIAEAERRDSKDESPSGEALSEPMMPAAEQEPDEPKERRAPVSTPLAVPESAAVIESVPPPAPISAVPSSPEWHRLAGEEFNFDFKGARSAIERQGGFDAVMAKASPDQLMVLADIATATNQPARAIQALRQVVDRFPNDPNAPLAALSLGHKLAKAGDRSGAAKAYAAYRRLSPNGDFAEDALAREVEVAIEQGNLELARQLTDQYAKDFPNGRRLGELRAQIAKLSGQPAAAPPSGAGPAPASEEEQPSEEPEEPAPAAGK